MINGRIWLPFFSGIDAFWSSSKLVILVHYRPKFFLTSCQWQFTRLLRADWFWWGNSKPLKGFQAIVPFVAQSETCIHWNKIPIWIEENSKWKPAEKTPCGYFVELKQESKLVFYESLYSAKTIKFVMIGQQACWFNKNLLV